MQCCVHGSGCTASRCGACYVDRNYDALVVDFPWLEISSGKKGFGVGCSICRTFFHGKEGRKLNRANQAWRQGLVTSYTSLQRRKLEKHQNSGEHERAKNHGKIDDPQTAPSPGQFLDMLKHTRKSPVGADGVPKLGGQKKCRKMIWCLAESHREMKRSLFKERATGVRKVKFIQSTTIFQDARKGKLTLRFTTGNSQLERREGLFGVADLAKDFSLDSIGLMKATMSILRAFCTRFFHPPHLETEPQPALDAELYAQVIASIEVYVSDAAADELRAGHMLARQSTAKMYHPHLPCLKIVMRDKPHAIQRNLTRGWKADDFLDDVASHFVFGMGSPTRLIKNSDAFQAWFRNNIKRLDPEISAVALRQQVNDLGFAPHRFASAAKPMTRISLFFHPFLATVAQIDLERRGKEEGKSAEAFLEWISIERTVQFSMLADCANENLSLTRLVDYQGFPVEKLSTYIASFKERVRALFSGDDPACKHSGCCGHILQVLRRQIALQLPSGSSFVLGTPRGVLDDVFSRCCQRMCNWIHVMEATIDAEFPHMEVIQAFGMFNVEGEVSMTPEWRKDCARKLSRLQKAFGLVDDDRGEVLDQFERLWYVARRVALDEGINSVEAWLEAARKATRTSSHMDLGGLMHVLVRFFSAGGSTSGVEQSFTQAKKLYDHLQLVPLVNDVMEARVANEGLRFFIFLID